MLGQVGETLAAEKRAAHAAAGHRHVLTIEVWDLHDGGDSEVMMDSYFNDAAPQLARRDALMAAVAHVASQPDGPRLAMAGMFSRGAVTPSA